MKKNELRKQSNDWYTLKLSGFKQGLHLSIPRKTSVGFFFLSVLLSVLLLSPMKTLRAESEAAPSLPAVDQFTERKSLHGTIGAVNHQGMAVITGRDLAKKSETEMWLTFSDTVRLNGYTTTADIQEGDEAVINYEENKEGTKRMLREVTFVQRNQPVAPAADEEKNDE